MPTDLGTAYTLQAQRRFTKIRKAGCWNRASVRAPIVFGTDTPRLLIGVGDHLSTYITDKSNQAGIKNARGEDIPYCRTPTLLHLDPLTLNTLAETPGRGRDGSPDDKNEKGSTWANLVALGDFCINEVGESGMVLSYGGDQAYVEDFDVYTGVWLPGRYGGGGINHSGIIVVAPDNPANWHNFGTAKIGGVYYTAETVYTKPVLVGTSMFKFGDGLNVALYKMTATPGEHDRVWMQSFASFTLLTRPVLGMDGRLWFFASQGGSYRLCGVTQAGVMDRNFPTERPMTYPGRIIPPAAVDGALYQVESTSAGLRILRTSLTDGKRTASTVAGVPLGSVFHFVSNKGFLIVQLDIGDDHHVAVIRGDKTPAYTPKKLPVSGVVPLTPIPMGLGETGTPTVHEPLAICYSKDGGRGELEWRIGFRFNQVRGRRVLAEVDYAYYKRDNSPPDYRLFAYPPSWTVPVSRYNQPPVGAVIASRNIGNQKPDIFRLQLDITDYANAQVGEWAFAMEGRFLPATGHSKITLAALTEADAIKAVRVLVYDGLSTTTPEPPKPIRVAAYDFGPQSIPPAPGYERVSENHPMLSGVWLSRDRGKPDALRRSFIFTTNGGVNITLPSGTYRVVALVGDATVAHDQMSIGGQVVSTKAGEFKEVSFDAVSDGTLRIACGDVGGSDPNFVLVAVEVFQK